MRSGFPGLYLDCVSSNVADEALIVPYHSRAECSCGGKKKNEILREG